MRYPQRWQRAARGPVARGVCKEETDCGSAADRCRAGFQPMKAPPPLVILLVFACLAGVFAFGPFANNDLWLHLKTGSLILEQGRVPRADAYTFTRAGAPYVAHEWLAELLLASL